MRWILPALLGFATVACSIRSERPGVTAGVGDRLQPFIIVNAETGQRYCQVCAYGGRPTIMAVFDFEDPKAVDDLRRLEKVLKTHESEGLTAFALFGRFEGGRVRPAQDPAAALADLKARAAALGLTFPVTTLPAELTPGEALHYRPFDERFEIRASRTVLLASADNRIRSSVALSAADAPRQLAAGVEALF